MNIIWNADRESRNDIKTTSEERDDAKVKTEVKEITIKFAVTQTPPINLRKLLKLKHHKNQEQVQDV